MQSARMGASLLQCAPRRAPRGTLFASGRLGAPLSLRIFREAAASGTFYVSLGGAMKIKDRLKLLLNLALFSLPVLFFAGCEDAGDDMEDAADEVGDATEKAADEVGDAVDDATN